VDSPRAQNQLIALVEHFCAIQFPEELKSSFPVILKAFYDEDIIEEQYLIAWTNTNVRKEYAHWEVTEEHAATLFKELQPFIEWLENAEEESDDESDE
jgi:translation initiation factor 5